MVSIVFWWRNISLPDEVMVLSAFQAELFNRVVEKIGVIYSKASFKSVNCQLTDVCRILFPS